MQKIHRETALKILWCLTAATATAQPAKFLCEIFIRCDCEEWNSLIQNVLYAPHDMQFIFA